MTHSRAVRRHLLLAGALVTIVGATSWPLMAQQGASSPPTNAPAAAPAPLPAPTTQSALADRPKSEAAQKLAPVAPPPFATAADKIPVDKLKAPNGFNIEVYATGMVNAPRCGRVTREPFSSAPGWPTRSMPSPTATESAKPDRCSPA